MTTNPHKNICVYAASSNAIAPHFFLDARELGTRMALAGVGLVYGAGCTGLMGEVARAVHASGGKVTGVIPTYLRRDGLCYEECDELIVTPDLRERKAIMESLADGFIGLPGGFGTLEEILEIITLKQLEVHEKPIVILNTGGYYDPLAALFDNAFDQGFTRNRFRDTYTVVSSAAKALETLGVASQ